MKKSEANMRDYNEKIIFSDKIADRLDREGISFENVMEVLNYCEHTGRKVYHPDRDTYSGYKEIGYITCWAEYMKDEKKGRLRLIDVYSHRMQIKL